MFVTLTLTFYHVIRSYKTLKSGTTNKANKQKQKLLIAFGSRPDQGNQTGKPARFYHTISFLPMHLMAYRRNAQYHSIVATLSSDHVDTDLPR